MPMLTMAQSPIQNPLLPQRERVINDINPPCSAFQVAKPQKTIEISRKPTNASGPLMQKLYLFC